MLVPVAAKGPLVSRVAQANLEFLEPVDGLEKEETSASVVSMVHQGPEDPVDFLGSRDLATIAHPPGQPQDTRAYRWIIHAT